jgi:hypothetical protein
MEDRDFWWRGMTGANQVMGVVIMRALIRSKLISADGARELIDEALLEIEMRQGGNPQTLPAFYAAVRSHLETALGAIDG